MRLVVATYNVHAFVGTDRRFDPERVCAVLGEIGADVVGLQEVQDAGGGPHALDALAEACGAQVMRGPTFDRSHGRTASTARTARTATRSSRGFPSAPSSASISRCRAASRAAPSTRPSRPARSTEPVRVLATHLGVGARERRRQVRHAPRAPPPRAGRRAHPARRHERVGPRRGRARGAPPRARPRAGAAHVSLGPPRSSRSTGSGSTRARACGGSGSTGAGSRAWPRTTFPSSRSSQLEPAAAAAPPPEPEESRSGTKPAFPGSMIEQDDERCVALRSGPGLPLRLRDLRTRARAAAVPTARSPRARSSVAARLQYLEPRLAAHASYADRWWWLWNGVHAGGNRVRRRDGRRRGRRRRARAPGRRRDEVRDRARGQGHQPARAAEGMDRGERRSRSPPPPAASRACEPPRRCSTPPPRRRTRSDAAG